MYAIDFAYVSKRNILLVDKCSSNPCANGAICVDDVNAYICACGAGYTGAHCEAGECLGLQSSTSIS